MNLDRLLIGIIQGVSEFLPISSSGHTHIFHYLTHSSPSFGLDVILNTATLVSVLYFFHKNIFEFLKKSILVTIASLPVILVVLVFGDYIDGLFSNVSYLKYSFLVTAVFLFASKFLKKTDTSTNLNPKKAFIIGLFQSIAIIPGISRSAMSYFGGRLVGLSPPDAFNFSFFMYIIASFGAIGLTALKGDLQSELIIPNISSVLIAFIAGIISLSLVRKVAFGDKMWYFSIYLVLLSFILFFI